MRANTLEKLETAAYRAAVDHGFFDLLLAAAVASLALVFAVTPWFVLALFPLVIAKQPLLRRFNRRVVEPHVGHVRLTPSRLEQISTARKSAAVALFGLAFIVARLGDMESPISTVAPMVWLAETPQFQLALIAGVGTAAAGWLFDLPRFLGYGLVILLAPFLAAIADLPAGTGWAIATLVILAAGGRVLFRSLRSDAAIGE